jgi:hypothetical protein
MPREKHKRAIPVRLNTEAVKDGGWYSSSDEAFVMKVERSVSIIPLRIFVQLEKRMIKCLKQRLKLYR